MTDFKLSKTGILEYRDDNTKPPKPPKLFVAFKGKETRLIYGGNFK